MFLEMPFNFNKVFITISCIEENLPSSVNSSPIT